MGWGKEKQILAGTLASGHVGKGETRCYWGRVRVRGRKGIG